MTPEQMRWWVEDLLDAGNRHDLEALRRLLAPELRRAHLPAGAEAWLAELRELFAAFPDWQWKRIAVLVEDDRVAVHLRAGGTHRGEYLGVPPSGRRVNLAEFTIYRVRAGRAVEAAGTADPADLARRLRAEG